MKNSRRRFLGSAGVLFSGAACSSIFCRMEMRAEVQKRKFPEPPPPADPVRNSPDQAAVTISQRATLQQHEKEFRALLASLSDRVNELQGEIQQLHSSDIFSIKIYRQTSEIEHLAKQLKTLAKS